MKAHFLLILIVLTIYSCSKTRNTSDIVDGKKDIQLDFAETTDKVFCNPDSIIPSDCSGGAFYFSKKGNVFYNFFCMGADSISYLIGKYVITDSLVTCVFNQEFSFYNGEYGHSQDGKPINPNLGQLKDAREFTLKLNKAKCELIPYYFLLDEYKIYVLRKPRSEGSIDFISAVKKIKILSDM